MNGITQWAPRVLLTPPASQFYFFQIDQRGRREGRSFTRRRVGLAPMNCTRKEMWQAKEEEEKFQRATDSLGLLICLLRFAHAGENALEGKGPWCSVRVRACVCVFKKKKKERERGEKNKTKQKLASDYWCFKHSKRLSPGHFTLPLGGRL